MSSVSGCGLHITTVFNVGDCILESAGFLGQRV